MTMVMLNHFFYVIVTFGVGFYLGRVNGWNDCVEAYYDSLEEDDE